MKTAAFYEKNFGAKRVRVREFGQGQMAVWIDLNGVLIIIGTHRPGAQLPTQPLLGMEHLGLTTDNIEASVSELKTNGVEIVQDVTPGFGGSAKEAYVRGPENVSIELVQPAR